MVLILKIYLLRIYNKEEYNHFYFFLPINTIANLIVFKVKLQLTLSKYEITRNIRMA